ncbi:hypothetical protein TREMEDRAFT_65927 [Tremella mesenterica DSM 1558]|uniref:uncharacterized protein n=1 Tax=Tremella mesenterica (strain ATCC 24925 / CBS 8224 / DSM 1558 / NBRC 9311 / NRRL Y-6157 / RJB 2259-6 / UBC 559-6) TaxID=578456 RepID=UPI00032BFEFB|nr:uncharacterized protein TREMEDRAFT_65927 [Tremella mesenterica DSM 1558]EIW66082.1 hypothetical protein TREMEDRAFT_65927 [Tremella mesenterica DSM 1558]
MTSPTKGFEYLPGFLAATCAVCTSSLFEEKDEYGNDMSVVAPVTCGHAAHETCLERWFTTQRSRFVEKHHRPASEAPLACPSCRTDCRLPSNPEPTTSTSTNTNANTDRSTGLFGRPTGPVFGRHTSLRDSSSARNRLGLPDRSNSTSPNPELNNSSSTTGNAHLLRLYVTLSDTRYLTAPTLSSSSTSLALDLYRRTKDVEEEVRNYTTETSWQTSKDVFEKGIALAGDMKVASEGSLDILSTQINSLISTLSEFQQTCLPLENLHETQHQLSRAEKKLQHLKERVGTLSEEKDKMIESFRLFKDETVPKRYNEMLMMAKMELEKEWERKIMEEQVRRKGAVRDAEEARKALGNESDRLKREIDKLQKEKEELEKDLNTRTRQLRQYQKHHESKSLLKSKVEELEAEIVRLNRQHLNRPSHSSAFRHHTSQDELEVNLDDSISPSSKRIRHSHLSSPSDNSKHFRHSTSPQSGNFGESSNRDQHEDTKWFDDPSEEFGENDSNEELSSDEKEENDDSLLISFPSSPSTQKRFPSVHPSRQNKTTTGSERRMTNMTKEKYSIHGESHKRKISSNVMEKKRHPTARTFSFDLISKSSKTNQSISRSSGSSGPSSLLGKSTVKITKMKENDGKEKENAILVDSSSPLKETGFTGHTNKIDMGRLDMVHKNGERIDGKRKLSVAQVLGMTDRNGRPVGVLGMGVKVRRR